MNFALVFIFGAVIGSFLNVCIYRLPIGKSVAWPNSYCPSCGRPIRFFDNIPILSYLFLMGKCRACHAQISPRYIIVELLTPGIGILLLNFFSLTPDFFIYWFLACLLIVITFIDLEYQIIPDVICLPGVVIGLTISSFIHAGGVGFSTGSFIDSSAGILAGSGSMYLMGFAGKLMFPRKAKAAGGAVGFGDVKLMAMIGAFIGWKLVLLTFFVTPFFGAFYGVYVALRKKQDVIPYGPFLSIGALVSLLYGHRILEWLFPYSRI